MSAGNKLSIALAAALLAIGPAACGGGDDSSSDTTEAALQQNQSQGKPSGNSGSFVPKQHEDSGGGSAQYRVKGGDNSIQEFGAEADTAERDEAATVLHNFLDARAIPDWESACSFLGAEVRRSLESFAVKAKRAAAGQAEAEQFADTSCAGALGTLTNPAALPELRREAAQADVASLRVEGDRAFVIYRGLNGTAVAVPMTNEGGSWKVASIGGTPIN